MEKDTLLINKTIKKRSVGRDGFVKIIVQPQTTATQETPVNDSTTSSTSSVVPNEHERAEQARRIMEQNQGLDRAVLDAISDNEILRLTAGTATNAQLAQTADNLIRNYPGVTPQ